MGEIFLARYEGSSGFEKFCVIKKILSHLSEDPVFVERFVGEAKILVKLSHGSIAQVFDMGLHDGEPYIALEHVDGKDLRKVAARQRDRSIPLPLTFVLYVMSRVLDALAYAHRKRDENDKELGLVHRDISPQNILISYEGEVKVIDFGLAKSALSSAKTNPSIILGKFLYMSPEQARHQKVDKRADLYSVGLCLYELISGKNPFDGIPPGELMARVANPQIPSLQEVDPLCPQGVVDVVMRALEVDPAKRFQTAEEMRGKLLACLLEIDPSAGPESVSRYMRDAFSNDYGAERKLLAQLKEAKTIRLGDAPVEKPADVDTAVVHLKDVAPSVAAAMGLSEPAAAAQRVDLPTGPIEHVPLSFAPTPRSRESEDVPTEGQTVPGIPLEEATRPAVPVTPSSDEHDTHGDWEAPDSIFDNVPKVTPLPLAAIDGPTAKRILEGRTNPAVVLPPGDGHGRTHPGLPATIEVSELLQGKSDNDTPGERAPLPDDTNPRAAMKPEPHEDTAPRIVVGTLIEDAAPPPSIAKDVTAPRKSMPVGRRETGAAIPMLEPVSSPSNVITAPTTTPPPRRRWPMVVMSLVIVLVVVAAAGFVYQLAGGQLPFLSKGEISAEPHELEAKPLNKLDAPKVVEQKVAEPKVVDEKVAQPQVAEEKVGDPKPLEEKTPVQQPATDDQKAKAEGDPLDDLLDDKKPDEKKVAAVEPKVEEKKTAVVAPKKSDGKRASPAKVKAAKKEWVATQAVYETATHRNSCELSAMKSVCFQYSNLRDDYLAAKSEDDFDEVVLQMKNLQKKLRDAAKKAQAQAQ
ncbi:MAG: protein kinase domain-containing protein [Myxococcaceae bacterium]